MDEADVINLFVNRDLPLVVINRTDRSAEQTLGTLIYNTFNCKTLELPWKENQRRISCIPEGMYYCNKRQSAKYGNHFMVNEVDNRSMILIHSGNYYTHTLGCILVGEQHVDINRDGLKDVTNSRATLSTLHSLLPQNFMLRIF